MPSEEKDSIMATQSEAVALALDTLVKMVEDNETPYGTRLEAIREIFRYDMSLRQ